MNLFPIDCRKDVLDAMVSREFTSKEWGGNTQETFPKISPKKLAKHGLNDWMYLPDNYQPLGPQVPGAPGIWINGGGNSGDWSDDWEIKRVFMRIQTGPALWMYQGQYKIKRVRSMTKEEWARQKPAVSSLF